MKVDLEKIYLSIRETAINSGNVWLPDFLSEDLPEGTEFPHAALAPLCGSWFQSFIDHPQVLSLLTGAVYFHALCAASGSMDIDAGALDQIRNFCIQLLAEHWAQGGDEVSSAFRQFWDLLLQNTRRDPQESLPEFDTGETMEDLIISSFQSEAVAYREKLLKELQSDFQPSHPLYEKIRREYQRKIGEHYRTGFIYLLGEYPFNEFYIPPALRYSPEWVSYGSLKWTNIFEQNHIIYVIGAPGSGKSLFLQNILNNYAKLDFPFSEDYLVVRCDLKTFYTNGDNNKKSIPDFLQESIINTLGMDAQAISLDFILYHIRLGRCLILLDALDEVPKSKRLALHKKAATYFKTAHPNNKVCITSRARGFLPQEDITVLKIPSLTDQDISSYIDRMIALRKFKQQDKATFLKQAQALTKKHFLNSFLVLSLLVNIYKSERKLPENKIDLYKKCFEYIAKQREEENTGASFDWKAINPMMKDSTFINLAVMAAPNNDDISREKIEAMLLELYKNKYMDEAAAEHAVGQFLEFCATRTELFVLSNSKSEDHYRFFHRSFFEYFYSRHIVQQSSAVDMYKLMTWFDVDSEVFELTVALIKNENEKKYQALVDHIFSQIDAEFGLPQPKYTAFSVMTLSMQVIDDAQYQKRYFDLVLEHPELMASKKVRELNQRLIAANLSVILNYFPDEAERFCQTYRDRYILSVLDSVDIHRVRPRLMISDPDEDPRPDASDIFFPDFELPQELLIHTQPFYVRVYPPQAADDLREEILRWDRPQFYAFLGNYPSNIRKRRRNFNDLMKLGPEARERLWRDLTGRALPESEPDA